MTQLDQPTEFDAKAADSGANATRVFQSKEAAARPEISKERVDEVATAAIKAMHEVIRDKQVTYEEYDALKAWMIQVGQDGEWPLFLDVWIEHVVEEVANADREGSKGTIEGPYYVPERPGAPRRVHARDARGRGRHAPAVPGPGPRRRRHSARRCRVDIWHADDAGFYSQFAPGLPDGSSGHASLPTSEGRYFINTMQPAPYQIPTDGSCGKLIAAAGWHAWRPAHIHLKVSAPDHQLITTQLYFDGDEYLDTDIASAVKPELMLAPRRALTARQGGHLRLRPGPRLMLFAVRMDVDLPPDLPGSGGHAGPREGLQAGAPAVWGSGDTSGAWSAPTPTSASSTSPTTRTCTSCCGTCRCSRTCT